MLSVGLIYQFFFLSLAYLLGSIPFGSLISRIVIGLNVQELGSRSIGATNVSRVIGVKWGMLTLLLDVLKGYVVVLFGKYLFGDNFALLLGACVIVGHSFPVWLNFKGGKGVASLLGILFAFNLGAVSVFICCWFIVFVLFHFSSLASLSAIIVSNVFCFYYLENAQSCLLVLFSSIIVIFRHKDNIIRLLKGVELKFHVKNRNKS